MAIANKIISNIIFSKVCEEAEQLYNARKIVSQISQNISIDRPVSDSNTNVIKSVSLPNLELTIVMPEESLENAKKLLKYYLIDQYSSENISTNIARERLQLIEKLKIALDVKDRQAFEQTFEQFKCEETEQLRLKPRKRNPFLFFSKRSPISKEADLINKLERLLKVDFSTTLAPSRIKMFTI